MTVSSCIALQSEIFKIPCWTYLSNVFKISRKISRSKNFCWIQGFSQHYKNVESTEIWENFVLLACKRPTSLILLSLKSAKNWTSLTFYLKCNNRSQVIQKLIETALFLLHWHHTFTMSTKMINFVTLPPLPPPPPLLDAPHPQKSTIDLLLKSNRLHIQAKFQNSPTPLSCGRHKRMALCTQGIQI